MSANALRVKALRMAETKPPTAEIELRVAEVIGRIIEFWGFKAIMGRLWTFLYLSPEPLSQAELAERLSVSSGSISMALADLQKWGVVKKSWRPGERRDFYEAETSIWKMVSRVFRERELVYIREAIAAFDQARRQAVQGRQGASAEVKKRLKFIEDRLTTLLALSRVSEGFLNLLLAGKSVDLSPFKSLFSKEGADGE